MKKLTWVPWILFLSTQLQFYPTSLLLFLIPWAFLYFPLEPHPWLFIDLSPLTRPFVECSLHSQNELHPPTFQQFDGRPPLPLIFFFCDYCRVFTIQASFFTSFLQERKWGINAAVLLSSKLRMHTVTLLKIFAQLYLWAECVLQG